MNYRTVALTTLVAATLAATWSQVSGISPARNTPVDNDDDAAALKQFMRAKLPMVGRIVEGISTEDFDLVRQGGLELAALSTSAKWKSPKNPYYQQYSAGFEEAVRGLVDAADAESVEKATFAYVHVTVSCTACHQHVRGTVRVAQ